ncbi:MAG TPA: hypothetical protein VLJ61_01955 [Pyrinomonadaceae bacterium]|nr:hypothetical protein [Pyrinomonadaceae bacterium]
MRIVLPGMVGGVFAILLGLLCFIFNRKVGWWFRRAPLAVFGLKEQVAVDEIIFRGLACLGGLFYAGIGLMLLIGSLR